LFQYLSSPSGHCKGVLIVADAGFGKTTIVEQLVEFSCFGECRSNLVMEYLSGCCMFTLLLTLTLHTPSWILV